MTDTSALSEFLITAGRTLAQMSLYNASHPSVKDAVHSSHTTLTTFLETNAELSLSSSQDKLLVNGRPQEAVQDAITRPFIQLLVSFDLHSLTFTPGITSTELKAFFNLAARSEAKKIASNLAEHFKSENVVNIKVNQAKYERIGEDETLSATKADTAADKKSTGDDFLERLGNLTLNDLIKSLVDRAVPNIEQRNKVFERVLDLVKFQIDEAVRKVSAEFNLERTRITNERERTEGVIETVTDGVVVVDENGRIVMMNPAAEHIYGVKLSACIGKPLSEGLHKDQLVALSKELTLTSFAKVTKAVHMVAESDTQKSLRASSAQVKDPMGRVVGMVSVPTDVSKHRELVRQQNEFMANVTHDLRTPIHALKLAVEAILEGTAGPVSTEQNKMLSLATRNVDRLSRLIDNLLDFTQIESGSMKIKPQIIELPPLLKEALASLEAWAKSRGVHLINEESGDLMPVFADSDRLLQIITNLISNAIKFTPSGGTVTLRAKSHLEKGKPLIQIEIEDTGKGIPKEDQKRIFERFVQLQNQEKQDIRGTGLGLSICKTLIDLHKGSFFLQSPPTGKTTGTMFSFTLPAVQKSEEQTKSTTATVAPTQSNLKKGFFSKIFSRFHILFVIFCLSHELLLARPSVGTVRRVLSGDSIQLSDGDIVRYLGIDAPDKGTPTYEDSVSANKRLVLHKEILLEYGVQERDLNGAWLAYVYADGVFVNKVMVREGHALVTPLTNEKKELRELVKAEREAQRKKRGLWSDSVLGTPQPKTETPQ